MHSRDESRNLAFACLALGEATCVPEMRDALVRMAMRLAGTAPDQTCRVPVSARELRAPASKSPSWVLGLI